MGPATSMPQAMARARSEAQGHRPWRTAGLAVLAGWALVWLAQAEAVGAAVTLWLTHNAYGHGLAVLPVAAAIAWTDRTRWQHLPLRPALSALPLALAFAVLSRWGAEHDVLEAEQLAIPGMMIAVAIAGVGWRIAGAWWLALASLLLLAPGGTPVLPLLQEIATRLTTAQLALFGVPHEVDGFYIRVSTGLYLVAPGCAGLNFILAGATVLPLFTVMLFDGWAKRIAVLALMGLAIVLANGVRIFGIIYLAEATDRQIDIASDHLFYGWLFFAVVLGLMMALAAWFADPPREAPAARPAPSADPAVPRAPVVPVLVPLAVAAIAVAAARLPVGSLFGGT